MPELSPSPTNVAAVVLAAGRSSRMGQPKLLMRFHGRTVLEHTLERVAQAGVEPVVVVVGNRGEETAALVRPPAEVVVNSRFAEGMSTSLRAGIEAVAGRCAAALVVLGDQPLLAPALVRDLVALYRSSGKPIVQPLYGAQPGNPVLFDRSLFPEVLQAQGDVGARDVVRRHAAEVARLPAPLEQALDVDTPDDFERLLSVLESAPGSGVMYDAATGAPGHVDTAPHAERSGDTSP